MKKFFSFLFIAIFAFSLSICACATKPYDLNENLTIGESQKITPRSFSRRFDEHINGIEWTHLLWDINAWTDARVEVAVNDDGGAPVMIRVHEFNQEPQMATLESGESAVFYLRDGREFFVDAQYVDGYMEGNISGYIHLADY